MRTLVLLSAVAVYILWRIVYARYSHQRWWQRSEAVLFTVCGLGVGALSARVGYAPGWWLGLGLALCGVGLWVGSRRPDSPCRTGTSGR